MRNVAQESAVWKQQTRDRKQGSLPLHQASPLPKKDLGEIKLR